LPGTFSFPVSKDQPLLTNIEDLLERPEPYEHTYQIYEEMVQRWIRRERVKDKEELRKFSEAIAQDMYIYSQSELKKIRELRLFNNQLTDIGT
jgi:hypothetical protein